ncbi:MAG: hypothetical protein IT258_04405 [Saprospiraceae bacterium]|nr:hypothetical protein [Saprospiraceae bacterium]
MRACCRLAFYCKATSTHRNLNPSTNYFDDLSKKETGKLVVLPFLVQRICLKNKGVGAAKATPTPRIVNLSIPASRQTG